MVTNVAITTIKQGILIFLGMKFLISETSRFEKTRTKVDAAPIPIAFSTEVDTARVGHSPSRRTKTGLR